ncbi:MAG: ferrochelatase [Prevotellaceae bacterium]|jgi:ferrochelatase|nr:ferrochelatase [Prevotellaceae bacterium]
MSTKTAILLVNVGSPNSPQTKDVRRYLKQFLYNKRVIGVPKFPRWFLANYIIAPFRAPKSAKLYKQLWTANGAPLVHYTQLVNEKLQAELEKKADVFVGMNYGKPFIRETLQIVRQVGYAKLIVLPMFPQYASSSSGATIETVMSLVKQWTVIPEIHIVNQFYNHPLFIKAFADRIKSSHPEDYEHIIFSYHGLPVSHLQQTCAIPDYTECNCEHTDSQNNNTCYRFACYQTTRLLANELNLDKSTYSVGFQSRMSQGWIQPFTNKLLIAKARQGVKKILAVSPSFVTDCLETTIEIGFEYRKLFQEYGGQKLDLVESLNDSPLWINALKNILMD